MPRTYIALDLETTGLSVDRDAIIEIGAVKFTSEETLDTFSTFVNPGRPIPPEITQLTGIRDADVMGAPNLYDVLPRLGRFAGELPVIGHNVGFDLGFIRRHSHLLENEGLDTFELAGVLLPHAERYSLAALARLLRIKLEHAHRALHDAQATRDLFNALLSQAADLPPRLLKEIVGFGQQSRWRAASFFQDALEEAARRPQDHPTKRRPGPAPAGPLFATAAKLRPLEPTARRTPVDVEQLAALLEGGGAFEQRFRHFEHRPQQVAMLRGIAQALNGSHHMLIEAPTGVGKSLAYLIPAVEWASKNGERVVISTNTINLQEQLYRKDLPDLAKVLPYKFQASVLKGRSHYLCSARLQAARRRRAESPDKARVLAKVLVWLLESEDGDGDSLFLASPVERAIWRQLSAEHEGCRPEHCRHFHRGECYFYRARHGAESAHVIVVNHALLLADVAVANRALPEYRYLIVDEAHHLEAATTNGLSFEADQSSMRRLLLEVGKLGSGGRLSGLLSDTIGHCQRAHLPEKTMEKLELLIGKIGLVVGDAQRHLDLFFESLHEFIAEHQQGRRSQYGLRLRVTSGLRVQPAWESVEITWDNARAPLVAIVDGLNRLARSINELSKYDIPDAEDLEAQILGAARRLGESKDQVSHMISNPDASLIYWLQTDSKGERLRLHAAPLHVGPLVEKYLFHTKESVILTSATLRTGGTFDFLRERLHAWEADELAVGSPFDFPNSTMVYLVDDIPEPNKPGYQRAVEQGMAALFRATQGRALALFTSYNQLRSTFQAIRAPLNQAGITVQGQGQGISRSQLLEDFRTNERQVLLGTRSFWEGVDVPGEALSCLVIAKLPFNVPSDPVFAARAETFEQPFLEYAVPETILRFLQGFGRLIRSRKDRGVVAVFDRRLVSKSYGSLFIESLPHPTIRQGSVTSLPAAAAQWLSQNKDNGPEGR